MITINIHQVVWFFEDEPITPGSDLLIETTESYTSLRIQVNGYRNINGNIILLFNLLKWIP